MKKHSAPDPFEIPKFLQLSAAVRRASWKRYRPPAPAVTATPRSTFADLAANRKAEREAKRKIRIDRVLARKAVPDRIAAEFAQRDGEFLSVARFKRIRRELPTKTMRSILDQDWLRDGNRYRRAIINGVVLRPSPLLASASRIKPARVARPVASDDVAARTAGLDRAALLALAKANGFFKPSYDALDNGRVMMTVRNVLRNRIKHGDAVKWD